MKIALLGDVALIGKYDRTVSSNVRRRLCTVKKVLEGFDYVICNLEAPLTDRFHTAVCKSMHLRSARENVDVLKYLGVSAVSLANNHMLDFGKGGLEDTIRTLEDAGIDWFGANGKVLKIDMIDSRISVSGFCSYNTNGCGYIKQNSKRQGINKLDFITLKEQIETDKEEERYSIVSVHWGTENTHYPSRTTINMADRIARLKENLTIYGHHPHVLQPIIASQGGVVAYSLGNFIFDDCISRNGKAKVLQQRENKLDALLLLTIRGDKLVDNSVVGLDDQSEGIVSVDLSDLLNEIGNKMLECDSAEYQVLRKAEIVSANNKRMGKHDLNWLAAHLNYYSIGAKILFYWRKYSYYKERKKFGC